MRQPWSQSAGDVDMVDVILVEGEAADEFLALLHELALEAIALRASSPGDPRPEIAPDQTQARASGRRRRAGPRRPGP